MRIGWRERLQEQPGLRQIAQWPSIPLDTLPKQQRKTFLRNQQIVAQALEGVRFLQIAQRFNVSLGRVSQLLNRALGGPRVEPPALLAGLVPYNNIHTKTRCQPLPTLANPRGNACAFKALLRDVPYLGQVLDEMIEANLKDMPYAQRVTPQAFHGEFKRILAEAQWPRDCYPYTVKNIAYEAVRKYLHARTDELRLAHIYKQTSPRRIVLRASSRFRAQRAIQIDEHTIDLRKRIHLLLDDALIPVPIGRATVLAAVDVDTTCILGYYLAPTDAPNQQDMLTLFDHCLSAWRPKTLVTPGLTYTPGACFPSGLQDAFPISFGAVFMDNAWMHRARSVVDILCNQYGGSLHQGLPATPKIRQLVESVFDYIGEHLSHRMPSTTGSHPRDPVREARKNLKHPPLVTFQSVDEALSVILTEYNVTPRATLGNVSPLALFQYQIQNHYVRFVPPWLSQQWRPLIGSVALPLHWYKHESRAPHVNFMYGRYQGPGLLQVAGKDTRIRVEFDRRDLRTLHAFSLSGEDLGELTVRSPWRRFPHTLATRQWIHNNAKTYRLNMRDPLADFFRLLLEHRGKLSSGLSLLRVYSEFTYDQKSGAGLMLGTPDIRAPNVPIVQPLSFISGWHREMAHHRR
ncbi:MAG: hypothetical protein OQL06_00830 [Gammaproteobacteria bacterium]|nr:hypothetical protein [Gammaproteobacteria bacterium]